ncbi:HK97-gp10 family putative phage morphogenesis protein [Enterobacter hormaechei]|uniref:HK97-gp10 family putative phage morphogenesis protein n=1 Tax=Enterobacter hormaechei TaxID=158836 RepID=UPI0032E4400F
MIETSLDFSGLNDIAKDLEALSRAENNKVLRDATRAGAEVLKEEVIARAPVRTGKLKKNVVVVTQKSRRRGEISSGVHIRGVNPRTGNSDNHAGILLDGNMLLHHMYGQLSQRIPYGGYYRDRTIKILRYKDLM